MIKRSVVILLIAIIALGQVAYVSAEEIVSAFDSRYRQGFSASARDNNLYIVQSPRETQLVDSLTDELYLPEADITTRADVAVPNQQPNNALTLNAARMVESLFFTNNTTKLSNDALKSWGRDANINASVKQMFDGKYMELVINDFSKGLNISQLFQTNDLAPIDILEMNPGGHGFEIVILAGSIGTQSNEIWLLPRSTSVGQLELLVNDTMIAIFKTSQETQPVDTTREKLYSNLDKISEVPEADWYSQMFNENNPIGNNSGVEDGNAVESFPEGEEDSSSESSFGSEDFSSTGSTPVWGTSDGADSDTINPLGTGSDNNPFGEEWVDETSPEPETWEDAYIEPIKPIDRSLPVGVNWKNGAQQRLNELLDLGFNKDAALEVLYREDYVDLGTGFQTTTPGVESSQGSIDDFFAEAGITPPASGSSNNNSSQGNSGSSNLDSASWVSGGNNNNSGYYTGNEYINTGNKTLDTTGIDLDPMVWGVSNRSEAGFGEVSIDGDTLIKDWSDDYEVNITSLTGGLHEYVRKKAVRPKRFVPIEPTIPEIRTSSLVLPALMILSSIGLMLVYFVFINAYVMRVRQKIKMAEIEGMKSSGGSSIGDLDSFEITS